MLVSIFNKSKEYHVKAIKHIMATVMTIVAIHPDKQYAMESIRLAFTEAEKIVDMLNIYNPDSEVSIINRDGFLLKSSENLRYIIRKANYFSDLCNGAFDITVLPVLKLWESKFKGNGIPGAEELLSALKLVNYRNIAIQNDTIQFTRKGMAITLAGIAKGFVVDKTFETLKRRGIHNALVNAGGDIRVMGHKSKNSRWKIGIKDPLNHNTLLTTINLRNKSVATSGPYSRPYCDLIDAHNGKPAQQILSSSIITGEAIDADILATAVLVLGVDKGMKLVNKLTDVEAIIVTRDGNCYKK